jgi:hypothetical protein
MKGWRLFGLLLDLAMLAASLATGGPVAAGVRVVAVIVAATVGGLVIFAAVVLILGVLAQRERPYEF